MGEMVVRIEGVVETVLEKLIRLGYFKTKSEAIRAGLLELASEYDVLPSREEQEDYLAAKKMSAINEDITKGKAKTIPLSKMKRKYPELAELGTD